MRTKHKYMIFIYPLPLLDNELPAPQNSAKIVVVSHTKPMKKWAKDNNRQIYIQKVW